MRRSAILLAGLLVPATLSAQLPDASTRALGMGGAYLSLARGYEAVHWNPAMLAVEGRPSLTIGLPQFNFEVGSNTYSTSDFQKYANKTLSDADKQYLLGRIGVDDSVLNIRTLAGLAPVGISIGPFAFSAGTAGDVDFSVGRDAIELALYGNVRRSGAGQFFTAKGSAGRSWAASTFAGSFAHAFSIPQGQLSIGVTYKKVYGHFLGSAGETSSRFVVNPQFSANATGHAIYTDYPGNYDVKGPGDILGGQGTPGSGYGVDLGAAIQFPGSGVTFSAVVTNAFNSMTWDASRLHYERSQYQAVQNTDGTVKDTLISLRLQTQSAINADPVARALRDSLLAHANFARVARVGVGYRSGMLSVGADAQLRLTQGLDRHPAQAVSAGAEYRLLHVLPLRVGAEIDFAEAIILSAGTGIQLLGLNIDVGAARISGDVRPGVLVGVGVGLIW